MKTDKRRVANQFDDVVDVAHARRVARRVGDASGADQRYSVGDASGADQRYSVGDASGADQRCPV
ncbi:MAG TPA: hypothetical protein VFM37_02385, partial [Pseudonocardiaceae bacterium]|nr:hypothetical protein [Pseudonocardiaceae bacterium]